LGSALVFERWQSSSLFFFNCPLFNYSFQLKKNKVLYLGKKQVPIALAEPLERWQSVGWAGQKSQRSVPIFFLDWRFI